MITKITQWLFVLMGIIALGFFFMPFSIWNWSAAAGLVLLYGSYLVRPFVLRKAYTSRQKIEFGIYTFVLTAMLIILAFQAIPLFAWVFFTGLIVNLLIRILR